MIANAAWKHPWLFGRAWAGPLAWWAAGRAGRQDNAESYLAGC